MSKILISRTDPVFRDINDSLEPRIPKALVWSKDFRDQIDFENFRAPSWFLGQEWPSQVFVAMIKDAWENVAHLRNLVTRLGDEDHAYGPRGTTYRGRLLTRDWLDSISEIDFLERHVPEVGKLRLLDVGAGYGRFAHRFLTVNPTAQVTTTDWIPESAYLCRRYLEFRSVRAEYVDPEALQPGKYDLAVNIHSWNECCVDAVLWWITRLKAAAVPYLFLVTAPGIDLHTQQGDSFAPVLRRLGYRLEETESKYENGLLSMRGLFAGSRYWLFKQA